MADVIIDGGGPFDDYTDDDPGYQPSERTAQDVWDSVTRTFGDQDSIQITAPDVLRWINDAQDEIVNRTRPLKARVSTNSVAGLAEYRFPSNAIIQVESLWYNGSRLQNSPIAQAEQEGWLGDDATGEPNTWWEWGGAFRLYPTPAVQREMVLYYSTTATRVAQLSDTIGLPDKYFQTILAYVLGQAYELDENMQAAQVKSGQAAASIQAFGEEARTAQNMTYDSITYVDQGW